MSKIALFSDIHGNKEALNSIINDIKKENIDEIICLGDTIGIGPNPKECMDMIIDNNIKTVYGNHELYFLKGTSIDDSLSENEILHQNWVKEQLTDRQIEYLNNCTLTIERVYNGKTILFEHFLTDFTSNKPYPFYDLHYLNNEKIKKIINSLNYDLIFIGHEHNAFSIDNKLYDIGSSGCERDNYTRYTIFDTDTFDIKTKKITYNRNSFRKSLLKHNYPDRDSIAKWFFGIEIQNTNNKPKHKKRKNNN